MVDADIVADDLFALLYTLCRIDTSCPPKQLHLQCKERGPKSAYFSFMSFPFALPKYECVRWSARGNPHTKLVYPQWLLTSSCSYLLIVKKFFVNQPAGYPIWAGSISPTTVDCDLQDLLIVEYDPQLCWWIYPAMPVDCCTQSTTKDPCDTLTPGSSPSWQGPQPPVQQ